jgi:hypothetical protein
MQILDKWELDLPLNSALMHQLRLSRGGGVGRRNGLKIRREQSHESSNLSHGIEVR